MRKINSEIEELKYWDSKVRAIDCTFLGDEVTLVFTSDDLVHNNVILFSGCYDVHYNHVKNYDKLRPVREMTDPQMPYYLQNIDVQNTIIDERNFLKFSINAFPLYLEIICQDVHINMQK